MNKIPKCRSKYFIPQANNIKPAPKDSNREHLVPKITQKNLKFSANRQFGKDITNSIKSNGHNIYNNHATKISIADKNSNNNIYIKKHSSASQVSQKTQKLKISINDKKLRENKSGSMLNKKCDVTSSEYYYYKNNNIKKEYVPQAGNSKLHSSISFGVNNNLRPLSSINSNSISVRLSNPKTTKIHNNINNKGINMNMNNNYGNTNINNNKIEITHSNADLM
jgi:hypothetical protein